MMTTVFATTRFESFHRWPDAPNEVAFLRDLHRHIFHVRAEVIVNHNDRDVEFILLGRKVAQHVQTVLCSRDTSSWSCEHWATELVVALGLCRCEVSEDGENGAVVAT